MSEFDLKNDSKQQKRFWELLLHTEKILTDRTNFFLVAESIFAATYAAIKPKNATSLIFIIGGIILSWIWLHLQSKTYHNIGKLLEMIEYEEVFPEYRKWKEKFDKGTPSNKIIAYWLPRFFLIVWLGILAVSFYFLPF